MSSPSVKRSAIALGLFALAVYIGYMIWIGLRF
jgi:hypothetical protein